MNNIGLIGNPNTGKTSLFNALTKSYEYVGNWAGVTVEKKVGVLVNKKSYLTDLPGVYSLSPLSKDEGITTRFLLDNPNDRLINVVDASQLERNLHLTLQLLESGNDMTIALNMMDLAANRGLQIHIERLSEALGVPIVPVIARTGAGCADLMELASRSTVNPAARKPLRLDYGPILEKAIRAVTARLPDSIQAKRWLAVQFFEGNEKIREWLEDRVPADYLRRLFAETETAIRAETNPAGCHAWIRRIRSAAIKRLLEPCVLHEQGSSKQPSAQRLDAIVTHKWLGIPIFLALMFLTFKLTFEWLGAPLSDRLDLLIQGPVADGLAWLLEMANAGDFIRALVMDGILAGVGGVIVFVPQIFLLFFVITIIEDSGYMARIATVMDRLLQGVGLNGKTFIPMIIGFGCNVPGVMAARTIEQPKERLLTILLTPLMSCSARLTVYSLFVAAFSEAHQALVVLSLYVLGVVIALALAMLFTRTIAKEEPSIFVIELPPYHLPQLKSLSRSTWEKGKGFVRKAGTFILAGSVVIWLLSYCRPSGVAVAIDESYLQLIGSTLAPLFAPLGFGSWQATSSLLTGFFAKEVVVSTMNILYDAPTDAGLQTALTHYFGPLEAYSFMVFTLIYVPCLATVGVIRKETGSSKWTWFSVGYSLIVAYVLAMLIYQVGGWIG